MIDRLLDHLIGKEGSLYLGCFVPAVFIAGPIGFALLAVLLD